MKRSFAALSSDLPASIFVFLVALPLCLGIALGSGAPLFSGIIAGIVGGIVVGIASGSSLSVSGPAAGLTGIVAAAITRIGSFEAFLLCVVLAGVFQILFGLLKAGVLADFIPVSVIKGMLAAIGLTLILKQIPHLMGDDSDFEGDESFLQPDGHNTLSELLASFTQYHGGALLIGLLAVGIMVLWETRAFRKMAWTRWIPAPLVAASAGTLLQMWFASSGSALALDTSHLVQIPLMGDLAAFPSQLQTPVTDRLWETSTWTLALTLALVASLETLLGIEAVDKLDPHKRTTPANRELVAQGLGNMTSGLLGGLPLTSVVVRSSANVTAGASSRLSTILHGVFLLLSVLLIPEVLNSLPLSALAGVLVFVGYKLTKPSIVRELYQKGKSQFLPFAITVCAILFTDLLVGIGIGLLAGLFFILRRNFRSGILMINDQNRYLLRFRKEVSFLNKSLLRQKLGEIPDGAHLLIDLSRCIFVDPDLLEILEDFRIRAAERGIVIDTKEPDAHSFLHTSP